MTHLAIIGAGQIGSRHLQALAQLNRPTQIQLVDPSPESLERARERFDQIQGNGLVKLKALTDLRDLSSPIDLAIIATAANVRRSVIERLLHEKSVSHLILEKVVFQSESDFLAVAALLVQKKIKAWVNCPFRMWPGYQKIASQQPKNLQFHVSGSQWGLACNSIHYLDVFSFLTKTVPMTLSIEKLDEGSIPSKRQGFMEMTGTLTGATENGSFSLTSWREGSAPVVVHMATEEFQYTVREDLGRAWVAKRELSPQLSWAICEEAFQTPFQSQLTHLAVQEILDHGTSSLPDYAASSKIHTPLLRAISSHLKGVQPCPIT